MQRFWVIRHAFNEIYVAPADAPRAWTRDELKAKRFSTEDAAMGEIITDRKGYGLAVQVIAPADPAPELQLAVAA